MKSEPNDAEQTAILSADGASRGNPGPAGAGYVVKSTGGDTIAEGRIPLGIATNNFAEYAGIVAGLQECAEHEIEHLLIRSDSQLLCRQLTGEYRVKSDNLKELYMEAKHLLRRFQSVRIQHVPREENELADRLANEAVDQQQSDRDNRTIDGLSSASWILTGRLLAMSYPSEADFRILRDMGISAVISLTDEGRGDGTAGGLDRHHFQYPDMTAPTDDLVDDFVATVDEYFFNNRAVAVHCQAGLGRTGTLIACYLVHLGMQAEEAIKHVRNRRKGSIQTREQAAAIYRYEERIQQQSQMEY